ncbi:hypothetical protein Pmani_013113 [Petrolisthes manimaculis]|uniref:Uncharacterized protein n=1 Tax=Petrolisthes manimaculis TaxID=1843537 RepID=A0AAE1PY62_9EUCA|nr:hypothetical protein Pmani_013113 [Petrolisthes manimaculis]
MREVRRGEGDEGGEVDCVAVEYPASSVECLRAASLSVNVAATVMVVPGEVEGGGHVKRQVTPHKRPRRDDSIQATRELRVLEAWGLTLHLCLTGHRHHLRQIL